MKPLALCLAAISLSVFGCAANVGSHKSTLETASLADTHATTEATEGAAKTDDAPRADGSVDGRKVGDYVVFSFEGSFYKTPLTLTERVVERDAASITIELSLAEKGKKPEVLRVKTGATAANHGEVLSVAKAAEGGAFTAMKTSDYDTFIAKTVASADENEAILDSSEEVVTVHDSKIPVTKTRYRVKIGKQAATMSTLASDRFSWGDLGGEIKTDAGALVYRASLVDMGEGAGSVAALDAPTTAN